MVYLLDVGNELSMIFELANSFNIEPEIVLRATLETPKSISSTSIRQPDHIPDVRITRIRIGHMFAIEYGIMTNVASLLAQKISELYIHSGLMSLLNQNIIAVMYNHDARTFTVYTE